MERVCRECGSLVNGDAKFCPVCGKVMERAVDLDKQRADVMPPQMPQNAAPGAMMNVTAQPMQQPVQPRNNVGNTAGYGAPQYGGGGVPQNIQQPMRPIGNYEHMSTGEWVLTIIVCSFFGIISLILNIVWGFGASTPEPKRTFCRASFYISLVTTILGVLFGLVFMGFALSEAIYY